MFLYNSALFNVVPIQTPVQIDELYLRNSRNDMNDSLLSLFSEVLVTPVLATDRLVMEHALLIAVLHANVGMEIGNWQPPHYMSGNTAFIYIDINLSAEEMSQYPYLKKMLKRDITK